MEKIEKTLKFNRLLSFYGVLLSPTQKDILEAYFFYDLSISEIASERGISRAAVEDALQKGSAKLEEYEDKLHHIENADEILKILAKIKENDVNPELLKDLEDIERRLK